MRALALLSILLLLLLLATTSQGKDNNFFRCELFEKSSAAKESCARVNEALQEISLTLEAVNKQSSIVESITSVDPGLRDLASLWTRLCLEPRLGYCGTQLTGVDLGKASLVYNSNVWRIGVPIIGGCLVSNSREELDQLLTKINESVSLVATRVINHEGTGYIERGGVLGEIQRAVKRISSGDEQYQYRKERVELEASLGFLLNQGHKGKAILLLEGGLDISLYPLYTKTLAQIAGKVARSEFALGFSLLRTLLVEEISNKLLENRFITLFLDSLSLRRAIQVKDYPEIASVIIVPVV